MHWRVLEILEPGCEPRHVVSVSVTMRCVPTASLFVEDDIIFLSVVSSGSAAELDDEDSNAWVMEWDDDSSSGSVTEWEDDSSSDSGSEWDDEDESEFETDETEGVYLLVSVYDCFLHRYLALMYLTIGQRALLQGNSYRHRQNGRSIPHLLWT